MHFDRRIGHTGWRRTSTRHRPAARKSLFPIPTVAVTSSQLTTSMTDVNTGTMWPKTEKPQSAYRHRGSRRPPPPLGGERGETTMPGPVFFNTSPACLRQPDERCRPACTNRLPAYMVRLVRLCSRHRLFTELALDTHTPRPSKAVAWALSARVPFQQTEHQPVFPPAWRSPCNANVPHDSCLAPQAHPAR